MHLADRSYTWLETELSLSVDTGCLLKEIFGISLGGPMVKNSPSNSGVRFDPWFRVKIPYPCGQNQKYYKNKINSVTNSTVTLKMTHIKKNNLKKNKIKDILQIIMHTEPWGKERQYWETDFKGDWNNPWNSGTGKQNKVLEWSFVFFFWKQHLM